VAAPVRVLWLIKGLGPGGAERLLVDMARHIDRDRFAVSCAYVLPWKDQLVGELEAEGVSVTCLGRDRPRGPGWVGRLRGEVRAEGIRLVHAHLPATAIGARLGLMGRGRPAIVTTEHNTWDRYRPLTRRLNAWTFGMQDAAIVVSSEVAHSIGPRARPTITTIPNGVDVERLRATALAPAAAREVLGLPTGVPVVGTVGGLTAKKGHTTLVRAIPGVLRTHPEARFAFVGLPVDEEPVRRAVADAGVEERVVFAGYVPEASRLMRAFDVVCLPSLFEGMPLSLLEAMALGLPSVATRVGGVPEVATDGEDAVVVPPSDAEALSVAIASLLDDPALRSSLGERAASTAERFSIRETVRRTESVYDDALREAGRP
jgi:glycosyltransferase involved in cell wall biosynthesis